MCFRFSFKIFAEINALHCCCIERVGCCELDDKQELRVKRIHWKYYIAGRTEDTPRLVSQLDTIVRSHHLSESSDLPAELRHISLIFEEFTMK